MSRAAKASLLMLLLVAGCQKTGGGQNTSPTPPKVEADLAVTTLTEADAKSLDIVNKTKKVVVREVQEHLALTGWIMAKPGNEISITAPVAGYVRAAEAMPTFGQALKKGHVLFTLEPVLSPLETVQFKALQRGVENDLTKAKSTQEQSEIELKRAVELHKQGLKQEQEVELARLKLQLAKEDVEAAKDKQKYFNLGSIPLAAPADGTVISLLVSPGQYVPAAAPLVTVIDLNPLWVRVPVPEHDFPDVNAKESVRVWPRANKEGNGAGKEGSLEARPIALVPQIDQVRHAADIYYELPLNSNGPNLAKDQMVTVDIPLGRKKAESLVPYSAIIFDAHGGAWIYLDKTKSGDDRRKYERRRVELIYMIGQDAVVRSRSAAGEPSLAASDGEMVVASDDGAAAKLFSREFHKTPVNP